LKRVWPRSDASTRSSQRRLFVAKPFTDYTAEDYDLVTGVNLRGFFEVSKPAMGGNAGPGRRTRRQTSSTSLTDSARQVAA